MKYLSGISLFVAIFLLGACGGGGSGPSGGGGATATEVGKLIFEDTRLSAENDQACASCHAVSDGFADPDVTTASPVSEGSIAGQFGDRNAPTSAYAKFTPIFAWMFFDSARNADIYAGGQFLDGRRDTLEDQAKDPFLNPVEMANADKQAVVDKVQNGPYANEFMEVYGNDVFDNTDTAYDRIAEAIAAFERTDEMNPFTSKFDCYLQNSALYPLTTSERDGLAVFEDPDGGKCANCHTSTPDGVTGKVMFTNFEYFNIGVPSNPNNPANIADPAFVDLGLGSRAGMTAAEDGKFKTPTLRNVELTAPYMHNGVYATLEDVVQHYDIGVAVGLVIPEVDTNIASELDVVAGFGLGLSPQDYLDLVAFMKTLTDGTGIGICF